MKHAEKFAQSFINDKKSKRLFICDSSCYSRLSKVISPDEIISLQTKSEVASVARTILFQIAATKKILTIIIDNRDSKETTNQRISFLKSYINHTFTNLSITTCDEYLNVDKAEPNQAAATNYVWLNTLTGKFSESWDEETQKRCFNENFVAEMKKRDPGWKLLKYECLNDENFKFNQYTKLK